MRFARILAGVGATLLLSSSVFSAVFTVTKTADTNDGVCDADCSLREAVAAANAAAGGDEIYFALPLFGAPQTITLAGTEIVFAANGSLSINGTGANRLTVSGNNASRIFASSANAVVNLHHLRLTGGNGAGATNTGRGGAVYNVGGTMTITNSVLTGNSAANGGALNNAASAAPAVPANLTLINCVISNNSSTSSGAALQNFSTSTLHIRNTTVNNNTSSGTGIAGAFQANGTVTVTNSTFSGNSAPAGTGGGVYFNGTSMIMTNTTIVDNSSETGGGGLHRTGTAATANVRNTIIANNTGAATTLDAFGAITSQGNNLIGAVGTSTGWLMSDLQNVNPLVSPLGYYGGSGFTHTLLSGSPAINAGQDCVLGATCSANNPPVSVSRDQRGALRVGTVDIGAFEVTNSYRAVLPSAQVNQPYNQVLAPNAGSFLYSHIGGTLPPGVTVNTGGVIASVSGTPTQTGASDFSVLVINDMRSSIINYQLNVLNNPSLVPVSGRFNVQDVPGAVNTVVRLTEINSGNRYQTRINAFGYFNFTDIPAGGTYSLSIVSKALIFIEPPPVTIVDAVNLEF